MDQGDSRIYVPVFYALHLRFDNPEDKAIAAPADFIEFPKSSVVHIDMPGLTVDDVRVMVEHDNVLTIYGERKGGGGQQQGAEYVVMERKFGKFYRKFTLPGNADTTGISAAYREGVLSVTLRKLPPPPTPETSNTAQTTVA